MADELDLAAEREEIARQSALLTSKRPEGPQAIGKCLYCDERIEKPLRWCDAECRDQWERKGKR